MLTSFENSLEKWNKNVYLLVRQVMRKKDIGFAEALGYCIKHKTLRKLKARDPFLITDSDLEEVIKNTVGGYGVVRQIASLSNSQQEKAALLKGYLPPSYQKPYVEAILTRLEQSHYIPSINAGVIETQSSLNLMGEGDYITPEIRNIVRMVYHNQSINNRSQRKLEKMLEKKVWDHLTQSASHLSEREREDKINKIREALKKCRKI